MSRNKLTFDTESHRYFLGGLELPSVTEVLKGTGIVDDTFFTDASRDRGSRVHLGTVYYDESDYDQTDFTDDERGRIEAWARFRRETGFRPIMIEKAGRFGRYFAGTPDRIGMLRGWPERAVVEIKSGPVAPWVALQTAAYSRLFRAPCPYRIAVQLNSDGSYVPIKFPASERMRDFGKFLQALNTYNERMRR